MGSNIMGSNLNKWEENFLSCESSSYCIYQLKKTHDNLRFMPLHYLEENNISLTINDYDAVYSGPLSSITYTPDETLEHLYRKFNIDRPADYTTYSLSIGDVIAIKSSEGTITYYYVDFIDFKEVELRQPGEAAHTSHSEKDILVSCIGLMQELVGYFEEWYTWQHGEDALEAIPEEERFCVEMSYFHIVQHLFLQHTFHSGGTSVRAKCEVLGVESSEELCFGHTMPEGGNA